MNNSKLIVLQLNEINFDLVGKYVNKYNDLPNFKKLLNFYSFTETHAEDNYEELEPWIQWVSVHTGKKFLEHKVFRLGDIVKESDKLTQIFELLEKFGLRIGVVSSMNAANKLVRPAYFIPDPWTDTPSDNSGLSKRIAKMLCQTVNDNSAGRISFGSIITLIEIVIKFFKNKDFIDLLKLIFKTRGKSWYKAIILDVLVHKIHIGLLSDKKPDVSFVFLNAGAHIQHHYLFNSIVDAEGLSNPAWYINPEEDPVRDLLAVYDRLLGDYCDLVDGGVRLIVATGLTQVPYNRVKFYYRLKSHSDFLGLVGVVFRRVLPRMTRDFSVSFNNNMDRDIAVKILSDIRMDGNGSCVFGEIEVGDCEIFVTLTYPSEIGIGDRIVLSDGLKFDFYEHVVFVAVKNGMHSTRGFVFSSPNCRLAGEKSGVHVACLFDTIKKVSLMK